MAVSGYMGGAGAFKQEVKDTAAEMKIGAVNMEQENLPELKKVSKKVKEVKKTIVEE